MGRPIINAIDFFIKSVFLILVKKDNGLLKYVFMHSKKLMLPETSACLLLLPLFIPLFAELSTGWPQLP